MSECSAGELVFPLIGCALPCAGVDDGAQRESRCSTASRLPLYSDLLLHDVGTGDGIEQGGGHRR